MSLNTGDIFEGAYQLEERVSGGGNGQFVRWLADDITSYRRSEVVIDIYPADHVADLHAKANLPGVRMAGHSTDCPCRYVVWEKNQVPPVLPTYGLPSLNDMTRVSVAGLIDALPVSAHETLPAQSIPEYWHYGSDVFLIFYRKVPAADFSDSSAIAMKEQWKQALVDTKLSESIHKVSPEPPPPAGPSSRYWPVVLSLIGVLLAVGVYALRTLPQPDTEQARTNSRLIAFNQAIERGMAYEKKAAYPEAVQSFETALREAPVSEAIDARLDSLAGAYTTYAQAECTRYHTTGSPQLYFIPNQYYHYAAILTRSQTIETCQ